MLGLLGEALSELVDEAVDALSLAGFSGKACCSSCAAGRSCKGEKLGDNPDMEAVARISTAPYANRSDLVRYVEIGEGEGATVKTLQAMCSLAKKSMQDVRFVTFARSLVRDLPGKDYEAELSRLFDYVKANVRYVLDPHELEWVQAPYHTLCVEGQGDCFVRGTRVLRRGGQALVPIESLRVGDAIWGRNRWSVVENVWDKGVLPTWQILLNNGSTMRLTPDHKVYVATCSRVHPDREEAACSCPVAERDVKRVDVRDLRAAQVVIAPDDVLPTNPDLLDPLARAEKLLRVKSIIRDNVELPCVDVATDDHYVWLPEADWTVSNCDDHACLLVGLALAIGAGGGFVTFKADPRRKSEWSHVAAFLCWRKAGQEHCRVADTTQRASTFGWEPPAKRIFGRKLWWVSHPT